MTGRRARLRDERAVDDLAHEILRHCEKIVVGSASSDRITHAWNLAPSWAPRTAVAERPGKRAHWVP
jgi:hypothetical protein